MSGGACLIIIESSAAATKLETIGSLVKNGHIEPNMIQSIRQGMSKVNSELDDLVELIGEE